MHRKLISQIYVLALAFLIGVANRSFGQECPSPSTTGPSIPSQVRTLEGRLVFHDDIRGWFELRLKTPQCGQTSIQLLPVENNSVKLQIIRGCIVKSSGPIDFSSTGYYSSDVFQDVQKIEPIGPCLKQTPFPVHAEVKPDKYISAYTVDMRINYTPGDHPIVFRVRSGRRELRPWQAYAHYMLTGGFVLYGFCGEGFVIDTVFGTPQANPSHFGDPGSSDDMAAFDPESAAQSGKRDLRLGYTCVREPLQDHHTP